MGTVTKSIRIDEKFLGIIDEYNKLVKEMFGVAPTVNSVLSNTIVKGFNDNLQAFRMIASNMITSIEPGPGEKFNDELRQKCVELIGKYEMYELEFDNEVGKEAGEK